MGKLEGKIALITGGNSGIGLATAKEFVNEGAYVFITGRRERELAAAVDAIGKNVIGIQGDMAKLADLDRVYAKIKQDKGRLDIVFANAGVAKYAALGDITEELTRLRVHLTAMRALINRTGPVGKSIEFLLQEINREVNTMGAKSQNAALSQITIEMKGEVEKMREQVQNVE